MARFHFHITNGIDYRDEEGTDLPDLDAARAEALKIMAQTLMTETPAFWDTGHLEVTVADARDLTLFCLRTMAQDAASTAKRR